MKDLPIPLDPALAARATLAVCDLNGVLRGKRVAAEKIANLAAQELRMAASTVAVDVWGNDVVGNPSFAAKGDPDGRIVPTGRPGVVTHGSDGRPSLLVPMWFAPDDRATGIADPRHALARAVDRLAAMDLAAAVGLELEFYLVDPRAPGLAALASPATARPLAVGNLMAAEALCAVEGFLDEVYVVCASNDIAAGDALAEGGVGQFETTLDHREPLRAADDLLMLKHVLRRVAARHGLGVCFMAKPFADQPGSGMHAHVSLRDARGPIFADTTGDTPRLGYAVAGLVATMGAAMLTFAPHLNSFRRLVPDTLAPLTASWAEDDRRAAVRLVAGPPSARRIEHRVAGADANPYLVLAAILDGIANGLELADPPPAGLPAALPGGWDAAIAAFEAGPVPFDARTARAFALAKRQEARAFAARLTPFEIETYRETV